MIISGHQPVYLPWLGLFHKLSLCDCFVYMDTVQYLENDWNNRNKIRSPHGPMWLSIPINRKLSTSQNLNDIVVFGFEKPTDKNFWQTVHWKSIEHNYKKATYFNDYAEDLCKLYKDIIWEKLVDVCWAQFKLFNKWLDLEDIKVIRMSEHTFEGKKDSLVLDHCLKLKADSVVFGKQGKNYVNYEIFKKHSINVFFQDYQHPTYSQKFPGFETSMSVIDLVFNHGPNSKDILLADNITKSALLTGKHWFVE